MAFRVLCAFQSEDIFDFVKSSLNDRFECEVIKASSEALALFLAQKNFPCLVVSELNMQDGWGMNLLSDLKSESTLSAIPVVFLAKRPADFSLPQLELPRGAEVLMWHPIESYEFISAVSPFLCELKDDRSPETPE